MRFVVGLYIVCCGFLCKGTDIGAVTPISVKFCTMVHIGPEHVLSPFGGGGIPRDTVSQGIRYHKGYVITRDTRNPKFWPFKSDYLENGKSEHYMSVRA